MAKKTLYLTTTLPYVNAEPHIGFAMEIVRTDVLARFYRLIGFEVIFNTGTDEHGQKIYQKALSEKKSPQVFCDEKAKNFYNLKTALNLTYTQFIRTTNSYHEKAAQEFWLRCQKNGDIYKAKYQVKYCVGCEMEKTESELENNRCPIHPNRSLEIIEEENYFFRFSKYQKALLQLYQNNPHFIVPKFRLNELKKFVQKGLKDFSISRLKTKMPWGIPVPNDDKHVIYVWFDALVNYISTLGWPKNKENFEKFWPGIQIAGKDNLRQQGAIWQAMLFSAGLSPSKKIFVEGFITADGQKMSKSLGNVINPFDLVKKYGSDAVRYYLLKEIPPFDDGDFSYSRMNQIYQTDLANELGNLVIRLTNLGEKNGIEFFNNLQINLKKEFSQYLENFLFDQVLISIWEKIKNLNKKIDEFAPWNKKTAQRKNFLINSLKELNNIGQLLQPFLPYAAEIILKSTTGKIKKAPVLFPKIK
ncbi:MAG: methionine--tRNA ligase [Patescibacteria group bacterium]|nr:methionine--tRNA ligase [Patescibacteria group bacterium]